MMAKKTEDGDLTLAMMDSSFGDRPCLSEIKVDKALSAPVPGLGLSLTLRLAN